MMSATVISRHWARVEVVARQRDAQGRSDARRNRRQAPPPPPPSPPPPSSRGRPARSDRAGADNERDDQIAPTGADRAPRT